MSFFQRIMDRFLRNARRAAVRAYKALDPETRRIVTADLARYNGFDPSDAEGSLEALLINSPALRAVLDYRIRNSGNRQAQKLYRVFCRQYPASAGIEISGEIGEGLRIIHNCCVIRVEHAGKNLSVGPFAVIGKSSGQSPVIGDNVSICANATVIGGIRIGDGAVIGAASFVNRDVGPGAVVGGNPAHRIR